MRPGRDVYLARRPAYLFARFGPFGVTVWRRGALSLQCCGRFVQLVVGDWWAAT